MQEQIIIPAVKTTNISSSMSEQLDMLFNIRCGVNRIEDWWAGADTLLFIEKE